MAFVEPMSFLRELEAHSHADGSLFGRDVAVEVLLLLPGFVAFLAPLVGRRRHFWRCAVHCCSDIACAGNAALAEAL